MTNEHYPNLTKNLRLKWMWLRHTYTFNWAHKPLCTRFRHGIMRIGRLHVCRSCLFAYIGVFIGIISAFLFSNIISNLNFFLLMLTLALVIVPSYPRFYKIFPRLFKDGLRFVLGMIIGIAPFFLIYHNFLCGITSIAVMLVFWRIYFHQRRVRKIHACDGCPELNEPEICSGFHEQASAIRLYEIQATNYLYSTGHGTPPKTVFRS